MTFAHRHKSFVRSIWPSFVYERIMGMSDKTSWTAIRVSRDTKEKLKRLRELWTDQAHRINDQIGSQATRSGQASKRDEVGFDQVVRRLILLVERHQARARKSGQKRKVKNSQPGGVTGPDTVSLNPSGG
jgi:hypothetical protein